MASEVIARGSFTSDGTLKQIALRSDFDIFRVKNHTQIATTQATGRGVVFEWNKDMADNSGHMWTKQNASHAIDLEYISSGGFHRNDLSNQSLGAAQATSGTDVTAANPAVVTVTAHGYSNGDRVRIYGTTAMLQIAGYDFTIGNVSTNDFELSYLDASGFAAVATAGFVRKVPNNPIFTPRNNRITAITAANPMVVTLAVTHGLQVGQRVSLRIDEEFDMIEANGLSADITAVSTANNTITLDIDASSFTAFAFPLSAEALDGVTPAHIVPAGDEILYTVGAVDNVADIVMELPAGADSPGGSNGDVMQWEAIRVGYTNDE